MFSTFNRYTYYSIPTHCIYKIVFGNTVCTIIFKFDFVIDKFKKIKLFIYLFNTHILNVILYYLI